MLQFRYQLDKHNRKERLRVRSREKSNSRLKHSIGLPVEPSNAIPGSLQLPALLHAPAERRHMEEAVPDLVRLHSSICKGAQAVCTGY